MKVRRVFIALLFIEVFFLLSQHFTPPKDDEEQKVGNPDWLSLLATNTDVSNFAFVRNTSAFFNEQNYLNEISSTRINKLLDILTQQEFVFQDILSKFNLVSFNSLLANQSRFRQTDAQHFLQNTDNKIVATPHFIDYLKAKSLKQTFASKPRLEPRELTEVVLFNLIVRVLILIILKRFFTTKARKSANIRARWQ